MNTSISAVTVKKMVYLSIMALLLGAVSCNKENKEGPGGDDPTGSGEISYLDEKYAISKAYWEDYGEYDGIHYYQLYLFSDGVDIENESGFGNVLAIYFSTYSSPFTVGTIPYYTDNGDPVPTFEAEVVLEYDLDSETGIHIPTFADGEIAIIHGQIGENTIHFEMVTSDSTLLTGNYTGKVIEF